MNVSWVNRLTDDELDERIHRGRKRIQECMTVLALVGQRRSITDIAQHMSCTHKKVAYIQQFLKLPPWTETRGSGAWPKEPT